MRPSGRQADELRHISITRNYTCHAEGSVLIACGNTRVLCTASVESRVPTFPAWKWRRLGDSGVWHAAEVYRLKDAAGSFIGQAGWTYDGNSAADRPVFARSG